MQTTVVIRSVKRVASAAHPNGRGVQELIEIDHPADALNRLSGDFTFGNGILLTLLDPKDKPTFQPNQKLKITIEAI